LAFGALISATDPVAALAIFKDMNINQRLYAIVFGEAIMNDAVSIVFFSTTSSLIGHSVTSSTVINAIGTFLQSSIASTLFGLTIAVTKP